LDAPWTQTKSWTHFEGFILFFCGGFLLTVYHSVDVIEKKDEDDSITLASWQFSIISINSKK